MYHAECTGLDIQDITCVVISCEILLKRVFDQEFFDEIHLSKQDSTRLDAGSAVSHLGIFCLPMSHKGDARLMRVKIHMVCSIHARCSYKRLECMCRLKKNCFHC